MNNLQDRQYLTDCEPVVDFRYYLTDYMSTIDTAQLGGTYDEHYKKFDTWTDFELLRYWLLYNGVFDGGESMLMELKRLCPSDPRCNPNSEIKNNPL